MDISEFDMQILKAIAKSKSGKSKEALVDRFGIISLAVLDTLLKEHLVKIHERNLKPFMQEHGYPTDYVDPPIGNIVITDTGNLEVKRWKTKRMLTTRKKWIERTWGFLTAVLLSLISRFILL